MGNSDRVVVEVAVAAPGNVIWRALRDPVEIRRWHGWDYEGLDDEIRTIYDEDATASEVDGTLTVSAGDRFIVEEAGDGTLVRVRRPSDADRGDVFDEIDEGWTTFVQQLRFALERHPGDDRRTLFLSGQAAQNGDPSPLKALGLDDIAPVAVGQRYEIVTSVGDTLAGEVWFRSQHQTGISVAAFGDGLLVVMELPPTASVLITTYGLDDESFDRLRQRWSDWWHAHYRETTIQP
jgi:hypothetical protein